MHRISPREHGRLKRIQHDLSSRRKRGTLIKQMHIMQFAFVLKCRRNFQAWRYLALCAGLISACAGPHKPCQLGGDTQWDGKRFGGDRKCSQIRGSGEQSSLYFNHGPYREYYKSGKLALEGEFKDGRKHGKWIEYSEKGERLLIRVYESGVQKTSESLVRPPGAK